VQPTIFRDVVTCGAWTFNNPAVLPAGVTQLGINILDGWDDTAPMELRISSRGTRDGDIPADRFPLRSRHITLSGWMYCTSRTAARLAHTALVRDAFPRNANLTLTRFEPDAAKFVTCRRENQIELPPLQNHTGPHFRFLVPLIATDPLKYASTLDMTGSAGVVGVSTGGVVMPVKMPMVFLIGSGEANQVSVTNTGDADSYPVTTITGPLPSGWRLENGTTGEALLLDISLAASDSLVIDHRLQTVLLNSFPVPPGINGDFWSLAPGVNVIRLFGAFDPAAMFSIVARSAWE
jgi:hypothetical protein